MVLRNAFVIARNGHGRPTLQHKLIDGTSSLTACHQDMSQWSRAYQSEVIWQLICKRCNKL